MARPEKQKKERLDKLMVDKGLCETRSQAQGRIMAGQVYVNEQKIDKAGQLFMPDVVITVRQAMPYVSRGGLKLAHALATFKISVKDKYCLDIGASTGGFTDCLLQNGAFQVTCIDVGTNQLDWKLRNDSRVKVYEQTHILTFEPNLLIPQPTLAVMDVSFISSLKVLPHVVRCVDTAVADTAIIVLIKPQFEYLNYCEAKGFKGVVNSISDLTLILSGFLNDLPTALHEWQITGLTESPITGPKGNREFLACLCSSQIDEGKKATTEWLSTLGL